MQSTTYPGEITMPATKTHHTPIQRIHTEEHETFSTLQLYALRYWYNQYHLLNTYAPPASSLSGEQLFVILLSKMESHETAIFLERLTLILSHYPERVRWHKKMMGENHLGARGGFGMTAKVMESIWGEKYLLIKWEDVTEEEGDFEWWW